MPFPEATSIERTLFDMGRGDISPEQWVAILDDLREKFKPWLTEYRLDRFGDVPIVQGFAEFTRGGARIGPVPINSEHTGGYSGQVLEFEGIFGLAPIAHIHEDRRAVGKQYTITACGMARRGYWCILRVTCKVVNWGQDKIDHVRKVERKDYSETAEFLKALHHPEAGAAVRKILTEFVRSATERRHQLWVDSADRLAALEADNRIIAIKMSSPYVSWGR